MAQKDLATLEGHLEPINHKAVSIVYDDTVTSLGVDTVQEAIEQVFAAIGGGGYTDEMAQDAVGNILVAGPGISVVYDDVTPEITISSTITQYTDEMAQDATAALIQDGTGISWSYNDAGDTLTPTVSLAPFSTTDLAEGSNLYYTDERVDDRVAALLVAGTGISLTYDDGLNTLTVASTITQYTDEMAQDAVGGALTDSATIDFTYNDGANTITAVVIQAGIDHGSIGGLGDDDHTQYMLTPSGAVVDDHAAVFDTSAGRRVKSTPVVINSSGNTSGIGTLGASGAVTFSNYTASRVLFTGTGGLLSVSSTLVWDNVTGTLQVSDTWITSDSITSRTNDLTVGTQTSGRNLLLTPAGTGTVNVASDLIILNQHSLKLREGTGGGTNFAAFQAPATLAGDYTLTMPTALPASTQALFSSSGGTLSFASVATITGTWTDNHVLRADSTGAIQDSLVVISDLGAITGSTGITQQDITWNNVNGFVSTADMNFTANGDMTFNTGPGAFNVNMIAFAGSVNVAAETGVNIFANNGDATFGTSATGNVSISSVGTGIFTASGGDLTLESQNNNVVLRASAGFIDAQNDIVCSGSIAMQANSIFLGAANDAVMFRDGTSLVINPRLVGSVSVNDVVIGSSSASGGNDSNLRVFRLAVFGSDILGTAAINCITTGGLRSALNFSLTFNASGTIGAPFQCNFVDQSTGNNILFASQLNYTLNTNTHSTTDATKATTLILGTGIAAATTLTTGTNHSMTCLRLNPNGNGVGGSHTVTNLYSTGLFQKKMTTFTNTGTATYVGSYWGDDVCIESNTKIIFDCSETDSTTHVYVTKGTTSLSYVSASTLLRATIAGTNVLDLTATSVNCLQDLTMTDAKNIVLNTTTGTKIGTSTSQKLGFWNATPVARPSAYTPTNATTDRSWDCDSSTLDELCDVVATLVADLQSIGLVG